MPTVQTNGVQTYYEEYGEGPPIVFLHGAMGDHRLWVEQAKPLAEDYRIIAYDLRGHGRTGGSERASYTRELYADDLGALITALNLDRPAICGLSMGGVVAQRYAATYPDTIAALCTSGTFTPEFATRGEWFELRALPDFIGRLPPAVCDRLFSVWDWINERRYGEEALGDLEKAERIQQAHAEEFPEMQEEELEKVDDMLMSYPSIEIDYASITVPSLLMYGEREIEFAVARHARQMASVIPDAECREIPNAGHNSHVDNPEFIIESLREFLTTATEHQHESNQPRE